MAVIRLPCLLCGSAPAASHTHCGVTFSGNTLGICLQHKGFLTAWCLHSPANVRRGEREKLRNAEDKINILEDRIEELDATICILRRAKDEEASIRADLEREYSYLLDRFQELSQELLRMEEVREVELAHLEALKTRRRSSITSSIASDKCYNMESPCAASDTRTELSFFEDLAQARVS
jgi:hypothetical protein